MYIMENSKQLGFYRSLLALPLALAAEDASKGFIMEIFLAAWLTMGVGAGLIAKAKGYGFTLWFIYGFFFGGIALLHSILMRGHFRSEHGF
jgi:hypothetical protein